MLFQKHTFKYDDGHTMRTFVLYSNYDPRMLWGLVEDAAKAVTFKNATTISDFIHEHQSKKGENRKVFSEVHWNRKEKKHKIKEG